MTKRQRWSKVVIFRLPATRHPENPGIQPSPPTSAFSVIKSHIHPILSNPSALSTRAVFPNPGRTSEKERQLGPGKTRKSLLPRLNEPLEPRALPDSTERRQQMRHRTVVQEEVYPGRCSRRCTRVGVLGQGTPLLPTPPYLPDNVLDHVLDHVLDLFWTTFLTSFWPRLKAFHGESELFRDQKRETSESPLLLTFAHFVTFAGNP